MIKFRMFKINTEQFATIGENVPSNEFKLETSINIKHSAEHGRIGVTVGFMFEDENDEKFIILKVCCEFEVIKEDWDNMKKDGEIVVPKNFLEYLIVQTIGTARGILHCKTEGTDFNSFIIPSVNVSNMGIEDLHLK